MLGLQYDSHEEGENRELKDRGRQLASWWQSEWKIINVNEVKYNAVAKRSRVRQLGMIQPEGRKRSRDYLAFDEFNQSTPRWMGNKLELFLGKGRCVIQSSISLITTHQWQHDYLRGWTKTRVHSVCRQTSKLWATNTIIDDMVQCEYRVEVQMDSNFRLP